MPVYVENDKNRAIDEQLLNPGIADTRFGKHPLSVFLAPGYRSKIRRWVPPQVEGVEYSNRQHHVKRFSELEIEQAWREAEAQATKNSARYFEIYLQALLKEPNLQLAHILVGVDRQFSITYQVYGYILT